MSETLDTGSDDPFAGERERLNALRNAPPRWIQEQAKEDPHSFYSGPVGPSVHDVLTASPEQSADYELLAKMVRHDHDQRQAQRRADRGLPPLPETSPQA